MGRHQIDLEFCACRDLAVVLQPPEGGVRFGGYVGVEQVWKLHILHGDARLERVALATGAAGMDAKEFTRFHEGRIVGEDGFEPRDPIAALAGLAVRNTLDPRPECGADGFKHVIGICHRHTADKVHIAGHDSSVNVT